MPQLARRQAETPGRIGAVIKPLAGLKLVLRHDATASVQLAHFRYFCPFTGVERLDGAHDEENALSWDSEGTRGPYSPELGALST
jgi:hypothetical protein